MLPVFGSNRQRSAIAVMRFRNCSAAFASSLCLQQVIPYLIVDGRQLGYYVVHIQERVMFARRVLLLAIVAAVVSATTAFGHSTTWRLRDVTLTDGTQATGTFTYDSHTGAIVAWNIVTTDGELPALTYTQATSEAAVPPSASGPFRFDTNDGLRYISLKPSVPLPHGVTAAIPLTLGSIDSGEQLCTPPFFICRARLAVSGQLFHVERDLTSTPFGAPTLSPAAIVLLTCCLIIIAIVMLRR